MKRRSLWWIIFLSFLGLILLYNVIRSRGPVYENFRDQRNLVFTKHIRCRMDCRHITREEVKEILSGGTEQPQRRRKGSKGDVTYTLEGYSHEGQHVRLVVAPTKDHLVLITCIDLEQDWPCFCN